ncbi:hypothetical protein KPATCC21470_8569 [Kitasatospora purpeofusca]
MTQRAFFDALIVLADGSASARPGPLRRPRGPHLFGQRVSHVLITALVDAPEQELHFLGTDVGRNQPQVAPGRVALAAVVPAHPQRQAGCRIYQQGRQPVVAGPSMR